jgi:hypothetical protein
MEKHPPMMMVENLAHEATNQMLRDLFAEFNPRRVRIVYRNSMPKGAATTPLILAHNLESIATLPSALHRNLTACPFHRRVRWARVRAGGPGPGRLSAAQRSTRSGPAHHVQVLQRTTPPPHDTTHDTHAPSRPCGRRDQDGRAQGPRVVREPEGGQAKA